MQAPELLATLAKIHEEAVRAQEMLDLAQRSPAKSRISGRTALHRIEILSRDRLDPEPFSGRASGSG